MASDRNDRVARRDGGDERWRGAVRRSVMTDLENVGALGYLFVFDFVKRGLNSSCVFYSALRSDLRDLFALTIELEAILPSSRAGRIPWYEK